ncbi:4-alpha-glucanotransferase [Fusobacterium russii]|uniref:4-alpha-glucanotransferase n=1 Tax=Fusobacterium russii TaxID=854 RepID=UPI0003A77B02|nr:4-alpha-glucanotransferase [Fusobacterium russii]
MRKAGILLPIFSLPSDYGIGSLGKEAYNFIDFLVRTGQSVWQILPLTSTNPDDFYSPYKTNGAFSGNYDFIDIDLLIEDGIVNKDFLETINLKNFVSDLRYIDYEKVRNLKEIIFSEAFKNFNDKNLNKKSEFEIFEKENIFWLKDFCSYMALKELNLLDLPRISNLNPLLRKKYNEIFSYHKFLQFLFYKQWFSLKKYANDRGIEILGDIPMYVSDESSDFYFNKKIFLTDKNDEILSIAGVPPDDFSTEGQCWGNPLYDWEYLEKDNFSWWIKRIKKSLELYDILRIDHFRAFESFYSIDRKTRDAKNGEWIKTPGKKFFEILKKELPNAKIIAEDLGIITDEVTELLEYTNYPGMKVIQFAFSSDCNNMNLPHKFYRNTVAYTGTHDNATLAEWLLTAPHNAVEYAKQYLRLESYEKYTEGFIRAVIGSCSDLAIVPLQDWLDFGAWARINIPSTTKFNWRFRFLKEDFTEDLEKYISYVCGLYGRYKVR